MSEDTRLIEEMDDEYIKEEVQGLKDDLSNIGFGEETYEDLIRSGVERNEAKLRTTKFFIEATDEERHNIWERNHEKQDWEEDTSGQMRMVGTFGDDFQVWVSFTFAVMNGVRICFYHATSRYVDHDLVEKYLEDNYPIKYDNGTSRAMTNATNFHHVFSIAGRKKE